MNYERQFSLADLREIVDSFSERRPAVREYNDQPYILTMALAIEAAEVLESDKFNYGDMGQELADVLWYLLAISTQRGIDLGDELIKKAALNEVRFPEEMFQDEDFLETYINRKRELGERK